MKQRITRMLTALALVSTLLVFTPLPVAAATAPTAQSVSKILLGSISPSILSHVDGSVTASNCPNAATTYNALKPQVTLAAVPDVRVCPDFANSSAVVDKSGTIYTIAAPTKVGDYNAKLLAFNRDGTLRWQVDPPSTTIDRIMLGANGKLYGISRTSNWREQHLFGYSNLDGSSPSLTFDKTLVTNGEKDIGIAAAYSNGIAIQYANDGHVEHIGYDGTVISNVNAQTKYFGEFKPGLDGQVYLPISSGKQNSFCVPQSLPIVDSINAYAPSAALWSFALKACSIALAIRPTPDGGVVLLTESNNAGVQKRYLTSIRSDGTQRWQNEMPTGTKYPSLPLISVNILGDIAITTQYTNTDSNFGVTFSLLSGLTGSAIFTNDIAPSLTSGSVKFAGNGNASLATTNGKAYLSLRTCRYSTNGGRPDCFGNASLYTIVDPKLAIDYPRGSLMQVAQPHKYYALGDSFASGEGVSPFIDGTDIGEDTCHRSTLAYAKLLEQNTSLNVQIPDKGFVACSGAETVNISSEKRSNEEPQIKALENGDADIVTISIGGNDVFFDRFVKTCMFLNCSTTKNAQDFFTAVNGLGNKLEDVYKQVLQKAPNANVYVVGYPQLLPEKGCSKTDGWMETFDTLAQQAQRGVPAAVAAITQIGKSSKLTDDQIEQLIRSGKVEFNQNEVKTARNLVSALDAKIKATVKSVNSKRLVYVDPLANNSPFVGHELCTDKQYFNGVVINPVMATSGYDIEYSFHPNQLGQSEGYYRLLLPYFSK